MENREKYLSATRILSRLSIEKMILSLYSLLENLEVSKKTLYLCSDEKKSLVNGCAIILSVVNNWIGSDIS